MASECGLHLSIVRLMFDLPRDFLAPSIGIRSGSMAENAAPGLWPAPVNQLGNSLKDRISRPALL